MEAEPGVPVLRRVAEVAGPAGPARRVLVEDVMVGIYSGVRLMMASAFPVVGVVFCRSGAEGLSSRRSTSVSAYRYYQSFSDALPMGMRQNLRVPGALGVRAQQVLLRRMVLVRMVVWGLTLVLNLAYTMHIRPLNEAHVSDYLHHQYRRLNKTETYRPYLRPHPVSLAWAYRLRIVRRVVARARQLRRNLD